MLAESTLKGSCEDGTLQGAFRSPSGLLASAPSQQGDEHDFENQLRFRLQIVVVEVSLDGSGVSSGSPVWAEEAFTEAG